MRSKSLLVGARALFEGPRIVLEDGSWLVGRTPFVEIEIVGKGKVDHDEVIQGPCVIFARVLKEYIGHGVYVKATQVRRKK